MKFLALPAALALLFCSCKEEAKAPVAPPATTEHHDHDGHDHGAKDDHGGMVELGNVDIGGIKVKIEGPAQLPTTGSFHAHAEVAAGAPAGVLRVWFGDEKASRSLKAAGILTADGDQHLDIELPTPAQAGDAIWIEVEPAGKPAQRASIGGNAAAAPAATTAAAPAAKPAATECSDPDCADCKAKAAAK